MKLIKTVETIYETLTPEPLGIKDMDAHIEYNRFTTTPINFFYEVGETDELVIFMNIYGFKYDESDGDDNKMGRVYQAETAVIDKQSKTLIYLGDNDTFSKVNHLSYLPIWTYDSLKAITSQTRDVKSDEYLDVSCYEYLGWKECQQLY